MCLTSDCCYRFKKSLWGQFLFSKTLILFSEECDCAKNLSSGWVFVRVVNKMSNVEGRWSRLPHSCETTKNATDTHLTHMPSG